MKPNPHQLPPVLFEDQWFIAYNKPAGLLTAPDRWDKGLENLMQMIHQQVSPAIFNAHRLDRDTSGVLLCAKDRPSLTAMCRMLERRQATKTYLALTRNVPVDLKGRIDRTVVQDFNRPGRMRSIRGHGRPCITDYEVLEAWKDQYALIQLKPLTGRTHQLRVHMSSMRCAIAADPLYGDGQGVYLSRIKPNYKPRKDGGEERPLIGRLALHAESLAFTHPFTQAATIIQAPLPKDFEVALKYLRRFAS
ncbi:MAG: RluA family pseudouridine synthase [Lentisphaerota bacterium]